MKVGDRVMDKGFYPTRFGTVLDTRVKLADGRFVTAIKWDDVGYGNSITWSEYNNYLPVVVEYTVYACPFGFCVR